MSEYDNWIKIARLIAKEIEKAHPRKSDEADYPLLEWSKKKRLAQLFRLAVVIDGHRRSHATAFEPLCQRNALRHYLITHHQISPEVAAELPLSQIVLVAHNELIAPAYPHDDVHKIAGSQDQEIELYAAAMTRVWYETKPGFRYLPGYEESEFPIEEIHWIAAQTV